MSSTLELFSPYCVILLLCLTQLVVSFQNPFLVVPSPPPYSQGRWQTSRIITRRRRSVILLSVSSRNRILYNDGRYDEKKERREKNLAKKQSRSNRWIVLSSENKIRLRIELSNSRAINGLIQSHQNENAWWEYETIGIKNAWRTKKQEQCLQNENT